VKIPFIFEAEGEGLSRLRSLGQQAGAGTRASY
jgi:hypothetical protein